MNVDPLQATTGQKDQHIKKLLGKAPVESDCIPLEELPLKSGQRVEIVGPTEGGMTRPPGTIGVIERGPEQNSMRVDGCWYPCSSLRLLTQAETDLFRIRVNLKLVER